MPTDAELQEYAARLPDIYRDILSAFPEVEPARRAGYGLAVQTLTMHFYNKRLSHRLEEVDEACRELTDNGFFEIRNGIFVHPTELGERLIAAVTGRRPRPSEPRVPQLPKKTW